MKKKAQSGLLYLILLALMYMPIFGHLSRLPIRAYDEARVAINAYEMHKDGNLIVAHFEGKPEMWNTKPPLLLWCQVFWMKIIGVNELAIRLPSALAAVLTCGLLLFFFLRYLHTLELGFIAVLVLITSQGYIHIHATRTGDYDALLTLFTTLGGLLFFIYCETQKAKYLYLFFFFTALSVLTKSITGVLFLPAIGIYCILQKRLWGLLKNKHFYLGIFMFLWMVGGFYLWREVQNPGYLTAVWQNELGGRYLEVIEKHTSGFWYYWTNFKDFRLKEWFIFIPCGMLLGFSIKNEKINRITLFSSLMVVVFFLVISTAETKLEWYDVPMYPFLAILIAIGIYVVFDFLKKIKWSQYSGMKQLLPLILLIVVCLQPYKNIINKTYLPQDEKWEQESYNISYYLRDAIHGKYDLNHQYLLNQGYLAQNIIYMHVLQDKGVNFSNKEWSHLDLLDVVIAHQEEVKKGVEAMYDYEKINEWKNIVTYKIYGKKN